MIQMILAMAFVLGMVGIAYADGGVSVALTGLLINTVIPALGTVLLGLASWAVKKFTDKNETARQLNLEQTFMTVATTACQYAEEAAAKFAKENAGKITTGSEKADMALTFLIERVPTMDKETARKYVHAALASMDGAGATGAAVAPKQ